MIVTPTDERLYQIMELLRRDEAINKLYELTKIDQFFLEKFKNIVLMERKLKSNSLTPDLLLEAKKLGFSDKYIGMIYGYDEVSMTKLRLQFNILTKL